MDNGIQNSLLKQKDIDNDLAGHIVESMVDNKEINQARFGIVVTKDILKKEGNLYFIPYWLLNIC